MNKRDVISPITVSPGVAVLVPICTTTSHNVDHRRATGHPTHLQTSYPFPLSHICDDKVSCNPVVPGCCLFMDCFSFSRVCPLSLFVCCNVGARARARMCVCVCVCVCECVCECVYVSVSLCECAYVSVYVYMCV